MGATCFGHRASQLSKAAAQYLTLSSVDGALPSCGTTGPGRTTSTEDCGVAAGRGVGREGGAEGMADVPAQGSFVKTTPRVPSGHLYIAATAHGGMTQGSSTRTAGMKTREI